MALRLKSLELQGYKTFANRTLFEFSGAVTAIVGPNGSGKSNIADSLRWVLGEQTYSLLRAKKTEDMIFSGSESRPRAGMAVASITFDNQDGWLPIDFSEVAVARKAYRDGENEYQINGQRVRLRDVGELLAQSGLSERTYTVIGQGLVDAALSLKAEERRRLFEEAAGIGLHRSRREEALRRLDTTRRNLERVQDILAELRPRLQSLERQARRAREYDQVKADLRVLLREWYGFHWNRAQQELSEARQAARSQEIRLEKARQEQTALEESLGGLRGQVQELRTSLNNWHRQLAQLHAQRESTSRDLGVAEERERALVERLRGTQSELIALEQEISLSETQLAEVEEDIRRLKAELVESRNQADITRKALEERQAARAQAEDSLRRTRGEIASLSARQGQLQALSTERQAQVERARRTLENTRQAVESAETAQRLAEAKLVDAQRVENEALQARQLADGTALEHVQQQEKADQTRRQTLDERAAAQAELARLRARLEVLEQAEAALSGYASGTKLLLQAAQEQRLPGVRGAFSKHLEVPAELEVAITAALGEYLDAVLLQDETESALDLLERQNSKGVLLPLEEVRSGAPFDSKLVGEGVLGVAAALVGAPEELRPTLDLLLGHTLVVRDREAARWALRETGCRRAVTLRGEVFYADGPIQTSGLSGKASEQTLLGRSRQQRTLEIEVKKAETQVREFEQRVGLLEIERKALKEDGERLARAQQKARQTWEQRSAATGQVRLAVEQAKRQTVWQTEQCQRMQDEISRSQKDLETLAAEMKQVDEQLSAAHQRQRQQRAELEKLNLDEFQAQAAHWNTLAAVAEQALGDAQERQKERDQALKRVRQRQTSSQSRLIEFEEAQKNLEVERMALRKTESDVGAQIQSTQDRIGPAETSLAHQERDLTEREKEEANARQALSMAEHFYAQTRITLDRRQESLDSLRRRIEEDFGLVAFEYTEQVSGPTPLPLDGMVEQLPTVRKLSPELEEAIKRQRAQLRRMGAINPEAQAEYEEVQQRYDFMIEQVRDLQQAEEDVRQVISELDVLMQREFRKTFQAVAAEFREIFTRLFDGGAARLVLTDPEDLTTTGIDIEARLPGRRTQGLSLLSGGERSLTATALVFALLKVSPTPFCVLDEVDAMLDEVNVGRFRDLLRELSQNTQFVIITHNRNTVQVADVIYGVTMGRDSVSQVLSLKLDDVAALVNGGTP
ncbi:MAG: chromosome segregation protein SMC [Chloroflexota bacterium]